MSETTVLLKYSRNLKSQGSSHVDVGEQNQAWVYEYGQGPPNITLLLRSDDDPQDFEYKIN